MNREQKKKLGVLAVLGLALLVGGTFAFRAFEQQAINDREREHDVNVGGRVHDYYNRDTEKETLKTKTSLLKTIVNALLWHVSACQSILKRVSVM